MTKASPVTPYGCFRLALQVLISGPIFIEVAAIDRALPTFWAARTLAPIEEDEMSSDLPTPIDTFDISLIRDVLQHAGFRYEEPMRPLDRDAARHALGLYQSGVRNSESLISAVNLWADEAVAARPSLGSAGDKP
ncbi:hypothetical protein [Rhizobium halophytocola]|uniref:Uncharacterized protein n=1 Tax=Rhizobium halophytocola TaxID=735519 RepID=A0ABS4E4A2_9HYPH|nr:hypothetical protein [Rhizobium halophytocola]MBP1852776.1 hypothetical protein [Rhizobium halophytocola]